MRVLVVCTGNSCRSVLLEAIWRHHWPECTVRSAGSDPTGRVHPLVPEVLGERGIGSEGLTSEPLSRYEGEAFDLLVTVCDEARDGCPVPAGARALHWPVPDPALFAEEAPASEARAIFRSARDALEGRILRYREGLRSMRELVGRLRLLHDQLPVPPSPERGAAYASLFERLERGALHEEQIWSGLPAWIEECFRSQGWEWNGFYRLRGLAPERRLELGPAAGPPVCATIEEQPGGFGASGMCFDAIHLGHAIAAADVGRWGSFDRSMACLVFRSCLRWRASSRFLPSLRILMTPCRLSFIGIRLPFRALESISSWCPIRRDLSAEVHKARGEELSCPRSVAR